VRAGQATSVHSSKCHSTGHSLIVHDIVYLLSTTHVRLHELGVYGALTSAGRHAASAHCIHGIPQIQGVPPCHRSFAVLAVLPGGTCLVRFIAQKSCLHKLELGATKTPACLQHIVDPPQQKPPVLSLHCMRLHSTAVTHGLHSLCQQLWLYMSHSCQKQQHMCASRVSIVL
jgi:hypothetical protein